MSRDSHNQKPASPSDKRASPTEHFSSFPARKALLHWWNVSSFVTRQFPQNCFQALWSRAWRLKFRPKRTGVFMLLCYFKITNLWTFCFWGCKEAALLLNYTEKSSDYADADVSKLCGSISLHPVRCPVKRGKDISHNCNHNFLHPNGRTRD